MLNVILNTYFRMGKYCTKYSPEWTKKYAWVEKCSDDVTSAKCSTCNCTFKISNAGLAQCRAHANSKKHIDAESIKLGKSSQITLTSMGVTALGKQKRKFRKEILQFLTVILIIPGRPSSVEDKILKAEILWALKCVKSGFSFNSNEDNGSLFQAMFPDSVIAASYKMSYTKCKYIVQYGICEWLLEELVKDVKEKPYSFLFDETTTVQIKKQYDAYIHYESSTHSKILTRYCGSSFHGHCDAKQLIENFYEFKKKLSLNVNYLLQIMMDGPKVNLLFQKLLTKALEEEHDTSLIEVGTCSLHAVHNGFQKGLQKLNFDFDGFICDLVFFFKRSSARREDFKLVELATEVETAFLLKHVSSRWLSLKKALKRIVEQWLNLKEYFLIYLPKQKNFAKDIETTKRYQNIRKHLTSNLSLMYMHFAIHIADIFEGYLTLLQSSKPIIHILYSAIGDLLFDIMSNFVKPASLTDSKKVRKDAQALGAVDVQQTLNLLSIHKIDFGKGARREIGNQEATTNLDELKTEFKLCYQEMTLYLQKNLPYKQKVLKDLQYIHKSNRLKEEAVPAIRHLATKIAHVLRGTSFTDLNSDR